MPNLPASSLAPPCCVHYCLGLKGILKGDALTPRAGALCFLIWISCPRRPSQLTKAKWGCHLALASFFFLLVFFIFLTFFPLWLIYPLFWLLWICKIFSLSSVSNTDQLQVKTLSLHFLGF